VFVAAKGSKPQTGRQTLNRIFVAGRHDRAMLVLLALLLGAPIPALAQSRGCIERPRDPAIDLSAAVPMPGGQRRARVGAGLPGQPVHGSDCIAVMPPAADVLRGVPAPPGGLLGGGANLFSGQ
jgi:hypothetical protein